MNETASTASTVVIVLDGDTDAGYRLASGLLADGRRVAVVARHPGDVVRVMHGYPAERVLARFGRIDTVVRAEESALRASA
jgi:hypothetical protein